MLDVQKAFDDPAWGARNNPDCERNIGALIGTWRERGFPVVFVRHDGLEEESPYDTLGREHPGNAFKEVLEGEPDLLVTKHVNSAFHGSPDLEAGYERTASTRSRSVGSRRRCAARRPRAWAPISASR